MNSDQTPPLNEAVTRAIARVTSIQEQRMANLTRLIQRSPAVAACPICGKEGATLNADLSTDRNVAYDCANCDRVTLEARWAKRQEAAGIPSDVRHATFENWKPGVPRAASDSPIIFVPAALDLVNRRLRNLILAGPPGVGKGHLAAAICNHAMKNGAKVRWRVMHRFFEASHRTYEAGNREDFIRQHAQIDLLVMDEIAMAEMPKDGERTLYDIVDMRHKRASPTIFLSNQAAEPIRNWMGPAIADRLRSGGVRFLWADWPSARGNRTKDHAF